MTQVWFTTLWLVILSGQIHGSTLREKRQLDGLLSQLLSGGQRPRSPPTYFGASAFENAILAPNGEKKPIKTITSSLLRQFVPGAAPETTRPQSIWRQLTSGSQTSNDLRFPGFRPINNIESYPGLLNGLNSGAGLGSLGKGLGLLSSKGSGLPGLGGLSSLGGGLSGLGGGLGGLGGLSGLGGGGRGNLINRRTGLAGIGGLGGASAGGLGGNNGIGDLIGSLLKQTTDLGEGSSESSGEKEKPGSVDLDSILSNFPNLVDGDKGFPNIPKLRQLCNFADLATKIPSLRNTITQLRVRPGNAEAYMGLLGGSLDQRCKFFRTFDLDDLNEIDDLLQDPLLNGQGEGISGIIARNVLKKRRGAVESSTIRKTEPFEPKQIGQTFLSGFMQGLFQRNG